MAKYDYSKKNVDSFNFCSMHIFIYILNILIWLIFGPIKKNKTKEWIRTMKSGK